MKILILNSKGHWLNGWMTFPESLAAVIDILEEADCAVETVEVASPSELEAVLARTPQDTLVWANAYWVNGDQGDEVGLVEMIERFGLPMVGSDLTALNLLLEKDSCQRRLSEAGIAVPRFMVFAQADLGEVRTRLAQSGIPFPMVVKPTKESRSKGVTRVDHLDAAVEVIHAIAADFPFGHVIVEEFLPTDDITCGYIRLRDEIIILPSFNRVIGMDCTQEVFGEKYYRLPPDHEQQVIIEDPAILQQLEATLPAIVQVLGVGSVTRIDGRLDAEGILRVFDINGMPGLNYPISALIKQCFSHFPSYHQDYVFACLIHTILSENFRRHGLPIPPAMERHHLFHLKSETIIKLRSEAIVAEALLAR